MPEGDTIHTLAGALDPRLRGQTLAGGRIAAHPDLQLAGRRVGPVTARGKHLFIELDGELVLRSHLGMHGSWHRYARGEAWKKPERHASIVLETPTDVVVCFHAREVQLLAADRAARFDLQRELGPDLVVELPPADEVLKRAAVFLEPGDPVADLLLDQRVASGVGNVYKSEVLFVERLHPLTRADRLGEERVAPLLATAHRLLRANLHGGPRVTRERRDGAGDLWVYRRHGRPCLRCGTRIESARLGRGRRSTYWCPRCQPAP